MAYELTRRAALQALAGAGAAGAVGQLLPPAISRASAAAADSGSGLTGRLVFPDSPGYDAARLLWDRLYVSHPLVIVYCETADDVVNAITWSRRNGVAFRARSGGHALEGWSTLDGGVVIDERHEAGGHRRGGGNRDGRDRAEPGRDRRRSRRSRVHSSDRLRSLGRRRRRDARRRNRVPVAEPGRHLRQPARRGYRARRRGRREADPCRQGSSRRSALACRGGAGGNFGIANAYTFRVHKIPDVVHFKIDWDWTTPWRPSTRGKAGRQRSITKYDPTEVFRFPKSIPSA